MASITASAAAANFKAVRVSRVGARRAAVNGVSVRPRAARVASVRPAVFCPAAAAKKDADGELKTTKNPAFNMALAAMVASSVVVTDAIAPEWAEAARSSGRMGGSSFRAPSRGGGSMGGQSRQAPNVQAMPQRTMGYGYGMPMFMPMPMFSPFGYGYGFGFGGLGFIFQIMIFFWIVNFVLSFLSSMTQNNNQNNRRDDDDFY